MATYRTSVSGGGTTGTGDRTATITPVVNDLFIVLAHISNTSDTPVVTDDNSSGTYTRIGVVAVNASASRYSVHVRDSLLGSTTSTVVSVAAGANNSGMLHVIAVSSMTRTGSSAVLQSASQANQAAGGTPAPAFGSSALTGNMTIGGVANASNPAGMTTPTNWTEQQDTGTTGPLCGIESVTRDSGFTGTTVTWGSTSATAFGSWIIELDNSAAPVATAVPNALMMMGAGV